MATSSDLQASSIIEHASPTKALFQSRLNNDITSLTAWLETLHAPDPLPRKFLHGRDEVQSQSRLHVGIVAGPSSTNDDGGKILEALKALKQANLLADHLRMLVHDARIEELAALEGQIAHVVRQRQEDVLERSCVDEIYDALEPGAKVALEQLGSAAVVLQMQVPLGEMSKGESGRGAEWEMQGEGVSDRSDLTSAFSQQMLYHAHRGLVLDEQTERLRLLGHCMQSPAKADIARVNSKGSAKSPEEVRVGPVAAEDISIFNTHYKNEQLHAETTNYTRDAKQVNLKVLEYQERIAGLQRQLSKLRAESVNIEDVLKARKQVEQRAASVRGLEQRLRVFHGLPPDLAASRNEIKRAALELKECKRKREDLFGRISSVER